MLQEWHQWLACLCILLVCAAPTHAVLSGSATPPLLPSDPDYAAGTAALAQHDWQGVIDHMSRVIARRPWDDQAYNLIGFAYRQLGQYQPALQHYHQALDLNPYHRGALEYLGETYIAMHCLAEAREALSRLEIVCKRAGSNPAPDGWQAGCKEWHDLQAAIAAYVPTGQAPCTLSRGAAR
jgi:tetratricopeptide (TPR) repeat protein